MGQAWATEFVFRPVEAAAIGNDCYCYSVVKHRQRVGLDSEHFGWLVYGTTIL